MLRTLAAALALCLAPLALAAQCVGTGIEARLTDAQRADLAARVAATPYGQGLLWQAQRDGRRLTIAGTLHIPWPGIEDVTARMLPAMQGADLLLVEATEDDLRDVQVFLSSSPDAIMLPEGGSLIDMLEPEVWDDVTEAARARGIPPMMAARMQPWFLALNLAMPPCAVFSMASGESGVDGVLMAALSPNMPVASLEDWRTTLDVFREGTLEEHLDGLRIATLAPDIQDELISSLIAAYGRGDAAYSWHINRYTAGLIPGVDAALVHAELDKLEQVLLEDRNIAWIPVIEAASAQNDHVAIAFGAGHLIGEAGVLRLLEQNGWQLMRLD